VNLSSTAHSVVGTYSSDSWSFTGTANYNNITATTISDTISQATPIGQTSPTATAITYGQALSSSTISGTYTNLSGIAVPGSFAFATPSKIPDLGGTTNVSAAFTPTDTANYNSPLAFIISVRINPSPVASFTMATTKNTSANLATNKLVLLASDAGVVLSISGVSATSANGGTVIRTGAYITYTPATDFVGADSFTYTLSDNAGGSTVGTVSVTVNTINASSTLTDLVIADSVATVTASGKPGVTYDVQASDTANGPWTTLGTATADAANGVVSYDDIDYPNHMSRFYRLAAQKSKYLNL
jgi:hypothetical protein